MIICGFSRGEGESLNGVRNAFEFDRTIETARNAVQHQPCGAFLLDRKMRAREPLDRIAVPPVRPKTAADERAQMVEHGMLPILAHQ